MGRRCLERSLPLQQGQGGSRDTLRIPRDHSDQRRSAHRRQVARTASGNGSAEVLLQPESVARGPAPHGCGDDAASLVSHAQGHCSQFDGQDARRTGGDAPRRVRGPKNNHRDDQGHSRLSQDWRTSQSVAVGSLH